MKRNIFLFIIIFVVLLSVCFFQQKVKILPYFEKNTDVIIVLSPHFDDAVLSLGGLISQYPSKIIVASFFTGFPKIPVKTEWDNMSGFSNSDEAYHARYAENENSLSGVKTKNYNYLDFQYDNLRVTEDIRKSIESDIEKLLNAYPDQNIDIFAPSVFTDDITHPDHKVIHDAFYEVFKRYNNVKRITFYYFEDIPYTIKLKEISNKSVSDCIHDHDSSVNLESFAISLSKNDLDGKLDRIKKYSSQIKPLSTSKGSLVEIVNDFTLKRCIQDKKFACEVIYKIQ